jgi:hypothetical protein
VSLRYAGLECRPIPRTLHDLANLTYNVFCEVLVVGDDHELERGIQTQCKSGEAHGTDKRLQMSTRQINEKLLNVALQELF